MDLSEPIAIEVAPGKDDAWDVTLRQGELVWTFTGLEQEHRFLMGQIAVRMLEAIYPP